MVLSLTETAGTRLPAADVNAIVTAVAALQLPAAAIARRASNQSINNTTTTALLLDTQDYDSAAMFAATDSKIYAPTDGLYIAAGSGYVVQPSGFAIFGIAHSGTTICESNHPVDASGATRGALATLVNMTAGQYVEFMVYQSSTAARNAVGRLALIKVGSTS